ncbi:MAG TPA: hypothetical protein VI456_04210, partial [Polyangia bacterium]
RMILHFSHIGLTDGRTFTLVSLSSTVSSSSHSPALETVAAAATALQRPGARGKPRNEGNL